MTIDTNGWCFGWNVKQKVIFEFFVVLLDLPKLVILIFVVSMPSLLYKRSSYCS